MLQCCYICGTTQQYVTVLLYLWHNTTICHSVVISVAQHNSMSQCCYICGTTQQYVTCFICGTTQYVPVLLYLRRNTTVCQCCYICGTTQYVTVMLYL